MLDAKLSTTLCTDNRIVSKTTMTKELTLAMTHFNISNESLKKLVMGGFKRSFHPGSYVEKCNYIRKVKARYELLEKEFNLKA